MLAPFQIEEVLSLVASMDRPTITENLLGFEGTFPVDFTPEFLDNLTLDRLRHVYAALCIHHGQIPAGELEPVAA